MNARLSFGIGLGALALLGARVSTLAPSEPCGLVCARTMLLTLQPTLRIKSTTTRANGMMSVQEVADLLTESGLACEAWSPDRLDDLRDRLPAIVHLEEGHFVVVARIGKEDALIIDPSFGPSAVPYARKRLEREWSGLAVTARRAIRGRSPAGPSHPPRA